MIAIRIKNLITLVMILMLIACQTTGISSRDSSNLIPIIVKLDNVTVSVLETQLRNSVQNHYLMHYAEPQNTYLEVILTIDGLKASPENTLDLGVDNLFLNCEDRGVELAFSRRIISDEHVENKTGEDIDFNYVYTYYILREIDFATCDLIFSDGQKLNLSQFIANTEDFRSTAQPEEKGTVLSGENNQTYGENAVIGRGTQNSANAIHTTVAGGNMNAATTSHATVAGGRENSAIDFYATLAEVMPIRPVPAILSWVAAAATRLVDRAQSLAGESRIKQQGQIPSSQAVPIIKLRIILVL